MLSLASIHKLTPTYLKRNAASADEPVWIIFLVTAATVLVAVVSLFLLINQQQEPNPLRLWLTMASVPSGWFTIHMMAGIHYAHLYWRPEATKGKSPRGQPKARAGLTFPGNTEPGGPDFLYFSFVVGMTAQTSDVEITNTAMRMVVNAHAVISFFFNTVLVAAAVNLAVSLGR